MVTVKFYNGETEIVGLEIRVLKQTQPWIVYPMAMTKSGKVFCGWRCEDLEDGLITKNTSFYAIWDEAAKPGVDITTILLIIGIIALLLLVAFFVIKYLRRKRLAPKDYGKEFTGSAGI